MRAADVVTPDPVCILVARPNAADFAKRDLWNVRSGPHPIVTFAALMIGVQRAISLLPILRVAAGLASLCPECRRRGRRSACVGARHRVPCRVHPRACRESVAVRPGEPWLWSTVA